MRAVLAAALVLAAAPVAAQVSTSNIPSAAGKEAYNRSARETPQFRDYYAYSREVMFETNLRRAGAWGECVATAAPADSRAYLASARTTSLLRWSFQRCQRKVGQFDGAGIDRVRRAALIDAMRAPAG